eukprot:GILI01033546.1.p1 GENE.GILI01033546.1~~GILI01033546.1.p1  ORF type:complete len:391 (+),score=2.79 GILI01033546.1:34-1173(+)
MQFGAFFSAVGACKKASDVVKDVGGVPDQAIYLWKLVDALQPPLRLASVLQSRSKTSELVSPALALCHEVLASCEVVLVRSEPDGRPFEAESWSEWWSRVPLQTKESISRVQLLPQLINKVQQCACVLQLALTTAQMHCGAACDGLWPFELASVDGLHAARSILQLFEMGRLRPPTNSKKTPKGSRSNLYQLGQGRLFKGDDLLSVNCAVLLEMNLVSSVCHYTLHFVEVEALNELRQNESRFSDSYTVLQQTTDESEDLVDVERRIVRPSLSILLDDKQNVKAEINRSATGNFGNTTRQIQLTIRAKKAQYRVEFLACSVPGQFCWFPLGNEVHYTVTAETFESIIVLISKLRVGKRSQIDEIWPEDESTLYDWARLT